MQQGLPKVVTDGRVLLGGELDELSGVAVIPRNVRVGRETLNSDDARTNMIRSLARESLLRGEPPEVLPPERAQFLELYTRLAQQHAHVVSVHYVHALDGAAREARVCRQLMQPLQQVDIYEAKTLEGGLSFLLRTAAQLAEDGASAAQVLALLRYLETHMLTLLLTPRSGGGNLAEAHALHRLRNLVPSNETLWHFEPKTRKLVVVAQGHKLHSRLGEVLSRRWGKLRYAPLLRYWGYERAEIDTIIAGLEAAGLAEAPEAEPATATFLPCGGRRFVELLLVPLPNELQRLRALVQDPIWWKGDA